MAQGYHEGFLHWLDVRSHQPLAWQQAADFGDVLLYQTPEELAETVREVHAVIENAAKRCAGREIPHPDARLVQFVFVSYPLDEEDSRHG